MVTLNSTITYKHSQKTKDYLALTPDAQKAQSYDTLLEIQEKIDTLTNTTVANIQQSIQDIKTTVTKPDESLSQTKYEAIQLCIDKLSNSAMTILLFVSIMSQSSMTANITNQDTNQIIEIFASPDGIGIAIQSIGILAITTKVINNCVYYYRHITHDPNLTKWQKFKRLLTRS